MTTLKILVALYTWQCACGQLNHDNSAHCSMCGAAK